MYSKTRRVFLEGWLKICFSYDPEGRRYVFNFTRIGATIIIFGAAIFLFVLVRKGRRTKGKPEENA